MLKHSKMHRLILSALAVMLVASLLLAVASFVALPSAQAAPPRPLTYCWDQLEFWCVDHNLWMCTVTYCCNHPDYCPQGCCPVSADCDWLGWCY